MLSIMNHLGLETKGLGPELESGLQSHDFRLTCDFVPPFLASVLWSSSTCWVCLLILVVLMTADIYSKQTFLRVLGAALNNAGVGINIVVINGEF